VAQRNTVLTDDALDAIARLEVPATGGEQSGVRGSDSDRERYGERIRQKIPWHLGGEGNPMYTEEDDEHLLHDNRSSYVPPESTFESEEPAPLDWMPQLYAFVSE